MARRPKRSDTPVRSAPDELQGLIDVYGRGFLALSAPTGSTAPRAALDMLALLPDFMAQLQDVGTVSDPKGRERKALAVALRQARRLIDALDALPSDSRANFLVEPTLSQAVLVGLSPGPILASVNGVGVSPGPVVDLLRALEAGLRAVLPSLPRDAQLYLLGVLALIDQLAARLLQAGASVSLQFVRNAVNQLVARILQLRHILSPRQFAQVMRPVFAFLQRLAALGARSGFGLFGVGLLKVLAAFAIGFAVGYVITKIPIGGGRNVGDAIADSIVSDVAFELLYGTESDCDALFGVYVRARDRRVRLELDPRSTEALRTALRNEIARLEAYLGGDCLDASGRRTFERELARLRQKLTALP